MKSFLLTAFAVVAAAANAAADITVITPWADSTWQAGGHGNITWKHTSKEANLKCEIQLMNGNASNSNMVAYVTNPDTPIACSADSYDIHPLNDFASGKYWIRIGQSSSNTWAYSGVFNFAGNGTARPYSLASNGASTNVAAASKSAAVATGSSKANGSASSSASQAAQSSDESAGMQLTTQIFAVAGGAAVAALALAM